MQDAIVLVWFLTWRRKHYQIKPVILVDILDLNGVEIVGS
jgi:hypothetical protein